MGCSRQSQTFLGAVSTIRLRGKVKVALRKMATFFKIIVALFAVALTMVVSTAPVVEEASLGAKYQNLLDEAVKVNNIQMLNITRKSNEVADSGKSVDLVGVTVTNSTEENRVKRSYGNAISKWPFGRG